MKKWALLLAAVLLLGSLAGCQKAAEGEVGVQSVADICGLGGVGLVDRFAGVVASRGEVEIKKEAEKNVAQLLVKEGDAVKAGQVLFTYEQAQAELDLEKGKLELEQMKATLEQTRQQKAQLEKDSKNASADQKLQYLLEIQQADATIRETEYNLKAKEKEIEKLAAQLENLDVVSEVDGTVTALNENGGFDNYGNEKPYIVITETGNRRVKGYVNEMNVSSLYPGMEVLIRSRRDDTVWHGHVDHIDFDSVQSNNQDMYYPGGGQDDTSSSSKYPFYVELDGDEGLLLGQHVYIEPDYGQTEQEAEKLNLPAYFVMEPEGASPYVWARGKNEKLEKRKVQIGELDPDMQTYEILSGLTAEDYIAFPAEDLKEGMTCVEGGYVDVPEDPNMGFEGGEGVMPGFEGGEGMPMPEGFEGGDEGMMPGFDGEDGMPAEDGEGMEMPAPGGDVVMAPEGAVVPGEGAAQEAGPEGAGN